MAAESPEALIDRLVDEGGMPDYAHAFHGGDPAAWPPEVWDALRNKLWQDCFDGDRYWWQPEVALIQSIYDRQSKDK